MIIDLRGVETRDRMSWKESGKKIGAGLGQLIEDEIGAFDLGKDRKQARAGRGLQYPVDGRERCGGQGRETKRRRRRELLTGLSLLGPARVRRQQPGDLAQRCEPCCRRRGFAEKRLSVFAHEEDGCRFAGVIGRLPVPGAASVGRAEGLFHGRAQYRGIDRAALFEMRKEMAGGGENGGGRRRVGRERKRGRRGGSGDGSVTHGGNLGRARTDEPARRSLSTGRAQPRPGRPLTLTRSAAIAPACGKHVFGSCACRRAMRRSRRRIALLSRIRPSARLRARHRVDGRARRGCRRPDGRRA